MVRILRTCIIWNSPILWLNCFLMWTYGKATSTQACIILQIQSLLDRWHSREVGNKILLSPTRLVQPLLLIFPNPVRTSTRTLLCFLLPVHFQLKFDSLSISSLYFTSFGRAEGGLPGTRQSSKINSHVFDPRIPNLSNFWAVRKPLKSFSTIKVVIFFFAIVSSFFVLAYT